MRFDGLAQYARVPDDGAFVTSGGFTVAAWIALDLEPASGVVAVAKALGPGFLDTWGLGVGAGRELGSPTTDGSSDDYNAVPAAIPPPGSWVHVAVTWDGARKRLYVDGVPKLDIARSIAFDGHGVMIGSDENYDAPALLFPGVVDEVMIYARALSDLELAELAR